MLRRYLGIQKDLTNGTIHKLYRSHWQCNFFNVSIIVYELKTGQETSACHVHAIKFQFQFNFDLEIEN